MSDIEHLKPGAADEKAEEAWAIEVKRRMADYRAGHIKTIDRKELRERLHGGEYLSRPR